MLVKLKVKRVVEDAKLPVMAHPGEDFGYDVFSAEPTTTIEPGEQKAIRTGIAIEMERLDVGWDCVGVGVIAKQPSGLALKRMVDVKAGVIDAGYRNEIKILLYNYGKEAQTFNFGDKIGQLVPMPVLGGPVEAVEELSDSKRGLAGWGSGHITVEPSSKQLSLFETLSEVRAEFNLPPLEHE